MGGYSATQIYQMFQQGPGPTGMYNAQDGAGVQQGAQDDVNTTILQLNQKMAAAWGGNASEQAQSGAVPLATAAQDATNALATHQSIMSNQADAFNTARNSVTDVPSQMPSNTMNDVLAVLGDSGPLDNQIGQYNASSQHNVQVYQTYSNTSTTTASDMPQEYGQIPVSNATITVVSPSSSAYGGPGYRGAAMVGAPGGASPEESEYEASKLVSPPGANGSDGTTPEGAEEGTPPGLIDNVPGANGGLHLPGVPDEPVLTTNTSSWVPPEETGVSDPDGFPGAFSLSGGNNNNDEGPNGTPGNGPNGFSGELNPNNLPPNPNALVGGAGPALVNGPGGFNGPGGAGGGPGGAGGGAGGGSAAGAADSLHGGAASGVGGGASPSDLTNSSRSGIAMSSAAAAEEGPMGGPAFGPGGAAAEGEGGMPMGMGGGRRGEEDGEHRVAQYLQEADPDALFGTDEMTAPRVIGE